MIEYRKKDGLCGDLFQKLHFKEEEPEGQRRDGLPEVTEHQNCFSPHTRPPASGAPRPAGWSSSAKQSA